ncbi:Plexin-B [Amphibalanus amphitrite]|uniref:Plexin-B n=1 Tax=Amphibalanus amphitrite TaxID=1232801 RepID=A0A6A4WQT9_AMPAM|nr:Plexin-B [Amphibalanus amphitrite]
MRSDWKLPYSAHLCRCRPYVGPSYGPRSRTSLARLSDPVSVSGLPAAFAELQTDMSDLTSALEHGRVIIHEHKTYVLNVLFPGAPDHPVGKDTLPVGFTVGVKTAMAQFEQLLTNRNFLLMLLEALESQKTFSSRDSVSVASLLTAVLLPRMEYLTSIVAGLLLRGRPATPRTLTRRSDTTLLERLLTCWLSVCLYEELREGGPAGRLLLLVRALHRLTERGPVDALTGAARYSLAESTLLKEQVDYKTVVVHASLNSNPSTLTCAALSCDTISQVKQKIIDRIFSSSADSHKPAPQDFDLGRNDPYLPIFPISVMSTSSAATTTAGNLISQQMNHILPATLPCSC